MTDPNSIKQGILEMTGERMEQLLSIWSVTFEPKMCEDTLKRFKEHTDNFYKDLLAESRQKEAALLGEIAKLRAEGGHLARLLHETEPETVSGQKPDGVPLTEWLLNLDKSIEHLRERYSKRRADIEELLFQQQELCDELGTLPRPLLLDPLPLPEEMDGLRDHLENLRSERILRQKEQHQLRQAIKQDMEVLELMPQTDAEDRLLNDMNHNDLTAETLEQLRQMRSTYAEQVQELSLKIDEMREKINVSWRSHSLEETDSSGMQRVRGCTEYTQRSFDILHSELQRCQSMRRQNLKTLIERLRVDIRQWWDLTLKSQLERERFTSYYNNDYSEGLLELHQRELDDLRSFYKCNKVIFDLYEAHAKLWPRMHALSAKASEPNRFNNRGGQLLKEEKERNSIVSKLPIIEQQITELVHEYQVQSHSEFLVYGENILEVMAGEWARYRQTQQQSSVCQKTSTYVTKKLTKPPLAVEHSTTSGTFRTLRNMSLQSVKSTGKKPIPKSKVPDLEALSVAAENQPKNVGFFEEFVPKSRSTVLSVGGAHRQPNNPLAHALKNPNEVPSKQAVTDEQEEKPRFSKPLDCPCHAKVQCGRIHDQVIR